MLVGAVEIFGSHLGRIPNCSEVPDTMYFIGGGVWGAGVSFPRTIPPPAKKPLKNRPEPPPFLNVALGGFLSRISHLREPPPPSAAFTCFSPYFSF